MRKQYLTLFFIIITKTLFGQYTIDYTRPESVLSAVFYAAKSGNFDVLENLCDPKGENDGDTKSICKIAKLAKQDGNNENNTKNINEFVEIFSSGYVNGETVYKSDENGEEYAKIPFYFKHPGGEERSNEEMILVKRDGKWFLFSF